MRSFILATVVSLMFFVPPLHATGCTETQCTNTIKTIVYMDQEHISIWLNGDELPGNCTSDRYFVLRHSHQNFKQLYAGLLTAKSLNKEVTLRTVDDSASCDISYMVLR
jgi:hypothetical protein